jgi:Zn finger protein HypA/HybF involved in hydrogenase expression
MARPTLVQRLLEQATSHYPGGGHPTRVHILVGALSNISPSGLRRQFGLAAAGSDLEGVELVFHVVGDPESPDALAVRVVDVDRVRSAS